MFERWTDRARRSLVLAQEHARILHHTQISAGHMLLGLLLEHESTAYRALAALGVSADAATGELVKIRPRGEQAPDGHIPFTPAAKRACENALRESLAAVDGRYVGPEHVLLALLREVDGEPVTILAALGVHTDAVRAKVAELLAGYEKAEAPAVPPGLRSDEEMMRVRDALLFVHEATCERCLLLAILCDGCRKTIGGCPKRIAIDRLPAGEVPADEQ